MEWNMTEIIERSEIMEGICNGMKKGSDTFFSDFFFYYSCISNILLKYQNSSIKSSNSY